MSSPAATGHHVLLKGQTRLWVPAAWVLVGLVSLGFFAASLGG
jgi:hypothetical protein